MDEIIDTSSWKDFVESCRYFFGRSYSGSSENKTLADGLSKIAHYLTDNIAKIPISELARYEIPSNLVTKITMRINRFTENQKKAILQVNISEEKEELHLLFDILKKKFKQETEVDITSKKETLSPKNNSLNKMKAKLSEERKIDNLLEGLYNEFK